MKIILKKLGLNNTEIEIYLALLPIEKASASVIAYQTNHDRSTARYTCNKLVKRGLLKSENKSGKTIYYPESPFKLLFLLEEEKRKLEKKEEMIHQVIGELSSIADPSSIFPKFKCYEGMHELKKSYDHLVKNSETKQFKTVFFSDGIIPKELECYYKEVYIPKRVKEGIHSKHITLDTVENRKGKPLDEIMLRETRFLDAEKMPKLNGAIHLANETLHYVGFSEKNGFALVVKNAKISHMFRSFFDILWSISQE